MCGITGYVGERQADPILREALDLLTYRGYDSAGIAVDGERLRAVGAVEDLPACELDGTAGIGHTRWATHGAVTVANAHPHTDPNDEWFVVHNGIIENADQLRETLPGPFESETDTEVIPHLLADRGLEETVDVLKGQYAFVAHRQGWPGLVAVRQYCPLVLGQADHGLFVASDENALRERVDAGVHLKTGDVARLTATGWTVTNDGTRVSRDLNPLTDGFGRPEKGTHAHYTIKEIYEQPYILDRILDCDALPHGRVHLIGSGSSAFAAEYGAWVGRASGIDATAFVASEYDPATAPDALVAVSQSGETADVLEVVRERRPTSLIAVTNGRGSTLDHRADKTVDINAGPEIGVAATKTWTATTATLARLLGDGGAWAPDDCRAALDASDAVYETVKDHAGYTPVVVIGSGPYWPVAREAALKLQELAYLPAYGFPSRELKHGPLALLDDESVVIGCERYDAQLSEADARGATTLTLDDYELAGTTTWLYLYAYHAARLLGRRIDRPRNLAKTVTVE